VTAQLEAEGKWSLVGLLEERQVTPENRTEWERIHNVEEGNRYFFAEPLAVASDNH
jgi:hypothetical protein